MRRLGVPIRGPIDYVRFISFVPRHAAVGVAWLGHGFGRIEPTDERRLPAHSVYKHIALRQYAADVRSAGCRESYARGGGVSYCLIVLLKQVEAGRSEGWINLVARRRARRPYKEGAIQYNTIQYFISSTVQNNTETRTSRPTQHPARTMTKPLVSGKGEGACAQRARGT